MDIAYLYYLPFCMVFVSSDKLHERVVPLFLRDLTSRSSKGPDLKADLKRIDELLHAASQRADGSRACTSSPRRRRTAFAPRSKSFGISTSQPRMMRKRQKATKKSRWTANRTGAPKDDKALIDMINRAQYESTPLDLDPEHLPDIDDIEFAHVSRLVIPKKGKWIRINPTKATTAD